VTQMNAQGQPWRSVRTRHDPLGRVRRISQHLYETGGKKGTAREVGYVRYEYGAELPQHVPPKPDEYQLAGRQPILVARPSVVAGKEHILHLKYNERGQLLEETERGYSPLSAQGRPASQPAQAQAIERSTRYQYGRVNGRSVLVAVDGPLPGTGDTVKLSWDRRGDHVQAMLGPLGQHHRWTQRDESGRVVEEVPSDGVILRHRYLPSGMPAQWTRGPAQARVQFDALNRPVR